jgi:hypothetical protein
MREVFSASQNRIIIRRSALEAESALTRGAFDAVVLYTDGAGPAAGADHEDKPAAVEEPTEGGEREEPSEALGLVGEMVRAL